jgi:K+-transporting ATPase ATPase B chain
MKVMLIPLAIAAMFFKTGMHYQYTESVRLRDGRRSRRVVVAARYRPLSPRLMNDAPALAQADVGVAMNTGTQATKEAGNMVDLDSNPTKLIEIVEIGKQLLMTRGALTTFSIANDVAKYFAIIPAMFAGTFPVLNALNIMHLRTPQSAILSAVIFNALIIVALIPLALRDVKYRPMPAAVLLRNNLWIYGVGGIVVSFIGIKIIDVIITHVRLA